jgi:TPR repeat protein
MSKPQPQPQPRPGEDLFQEGHKLYMQDKESTKAFTLFQQAASLGHPEAINHLLIMQRSGPWSPMDPEEYQRLLQFIPDHPLAMLESGKMFYYANKVERDNGKAKNYFERIIERFSKNSSEIEAEAVTYSIICLAEMYHWGYGVTKDRDKAFQLYISGYKYAVMANCHYYFNSQPFSGRRELLGHISTLQTQVDTLQQKVSTLERENQALRTEIDYAPDGTGFHQAQEHFETLVNHKH